MRMKYKATINLDVEVDPLLSQVLNCEAIYTEYIRRLITNNVLKKDLQPENTFEITDVSSCIE